MASGLSDPTDSLERQKMLLADLLLETTERETYPASLAQKRLWFLDQLDPETSAYNVHLGLWLRGSLDSDALAASLQALIDRHGSLRTGFKLEGAELLQVVSRQMALQLQNLDVSTAAEPYSAAYQLAQKEVERPFDLAHPSLFRACLIRVSDSDNVLLCTMHHIITDSWSVQIMAKEMATLYQVFSAAHSTPLASPLDDLSISYGDYSEWQKEWFGTAKVQQQIDFWRKELQGVPPCLQLRIQQPRPAEQSFRGSSQTSQISDEIVAAMKSLAVRLQATSFMLFLSAFKLLLYRASGQSDQSLGVPVAGRNMVETEGLVGFFVNTLVLRDDLCFNPTFPELVAQVRETMLRAFAHADVPFEKVVEVLQPERNLAYNPIFQVMFSVIKAAMQSHTFADLIAFPYVVTPSASIFDLSMTIIEGVGGHWFAQIDHNTDLFHPEDIARLLGAYMALLQEIIENPENRINDFHIDPTIAAEIVNFEVKDEGATPTNDLCRIGDPTTKSKRKVDPDPIKLREPRPQRSDEPLEPDEQLLVDIWKNLLKLSSIGVNDNFFDIGGHSLLAAQLIAQIQSATGRKIAVSAIFRAPTIREFAQLLRKDALSQPDPIVMRLGAGIKSISFFAVAEPGVDTFGFAQLARHLPTGQSLYKLQTPSPIVFGRPRTREELQALAKQYVDAMRSEQPHGPYCLGAMCEGVTIAQQMILRLESEGEEVALFAILDTWVLENSQIRPLWAIDYYLQRFRAFRAMSTQEKKSTLRRLVRRIVSRTNDNPGSGWNRAYWPQGDFKPPQFDAPVLLFKRPQQPYFYIRDPQMGWGSRSTGGVTACEIECGHVEMLREPHVRLVAETLGKRLQEISQREDKPLAVSISGSLNHRRLESETSTR